mgnify:CR=1 FL=1
MLKSVSTKFILGFNYLSGAKETITGFFNLYERAVANSLLDKDKIGLKEHLSPTRSNGLLSMVKQMRMYALAFKAKSAND